jgi:hypothetical protein
MIEEVLRKYNFKVLKQKRNDSETLIAYNTKVNKNNIKQFIEELKKMIEKDDKANIILATSNKYMLKLKVDDNVMKFAIGEGNKEVEISDNADIEEIGNMLKAIKALM